VTADDSEANLFALVSEIGKELRDKLRVAAAPKNEGGGVQASLPENLGATRFYSEALDKLRSFEVAAARDLFGAGPRYPCS
jgi:hypothetical protein